MTLRQAVQEVINQNIEVKYVPARFIEMTKGEDMEEAIIKLVLDPDVKKKILETLEKYKGKPIFIEELISMYYFNFTKEVIREAVQRTKEIQQSRFFYIYK